MTTHPHMRWPRRALMLVRREWWEHRLTMWWAPMGFAVMLVVLMCTAYVTAWLLIPAEHAGRLTIGGQRLLLTNAAAMYPDTVRTALRANSAGLIAVLTCFGTFFSLLYALSALYDERRDRSVLFWKSLPVGDLETVIAKLVVGCFAYLACALVAALALHVLAVLVLTLAFAGESAPLRAALVEGAAPLSTIGLALLTVLMQGLWMAPVLAYLLLCSALPRLRPILYALLPPLALALLDLMIYALTRVETGLTRVVQFMAARFVDGPLIDAISGLATSVDENSGTVQLTLIDLGAMTGYFADSRLWLGLLLAALFVGLAVRARRNRDDSL